MAERLRGTACLLRVSVEARHPITPAMLLALAADLDGYAEEAERPVATIAEAMWQGRHAA